MSQTILKISNLDLDFQGQIGLQTSGVNPAGRCAPGRFPRRR